MRLLVFFLLVSIITAIPNHTMNTDAKAGMLFGHAAFTNHNAPTTATRLPQNIVKPGSVPHLDCPFACLPRNSPNAPTGHPVDADLN